ncbi:hypothetical protein SLS58_000045 [Diplodia intermedia]|uniref:F-box domain-containing protein n=1 Tax=Diplodia intermedia TaxID=856260 RepID=A0ABR3U5H0_9PEZI
MSLLALPPELIATICDHLPNKDIKRLRLTCLSLSRYAPLDLSAVYLSPNRANIDVFLAVARHHVFRSRVKEIIWDDAQLLNYRNARSFEGEFNADVSPWGGGAGIEDPRSSCLPEYYNRRDELWGAESTHAMDSFMAHGHYSNRLLREQEAIIAAGEDVAALRTGLRAFSNLMRVTLTAEAWTPRWLFPRHETPFFRSLPANFWMPLPRAWHGDIVDRHRRNEHLRVPWDLSQQQQNFDWEAHLRRPWNEERRCFRGYTAVVTELLAYHAEKPVGARSILELVIDVNRSPNGLHHALFVEPSPPSSPEHRADYLNTLALFSTLPLTRLSLAINAYCPRALHGDSSTPSPWHCFGPGLRAALQGLTGLRHFSLSSNLVTAEDPDGCHLTEEAPAAIDEWIPAGRWPRLASFSLGRLVIDTDALVRLLAALPPTSTLERVELDTLAFSSSTGDALCQLRRGLVGASAATATTTTPHSRAWKAAAPWRRGAPSVVVMEELGPDAYHHQRRGRRRRALRPASTEKTPKPRRLRLVVDAEVDDFLYAVEPARWGSPDDLPCPFERGGRAGLDGVRIGVGRVVDDYDPEYCERDDKLIW